MAEPQGDGRRGHRDKKSHKIGIHRINDFLLGHVGQLSYKNVDDEDVDIGSLSFSRNSENPPSFHQVLPFEQWFAPTRSGLPTPSSRTFQQTKSQKYWLLKTHPDAYLGNADVPKLLSEQVRAARDYELGEASQTTAALAIGEITDSRNASHTGSWPVVATAAGEAAHILRISVMGLEDWTCGKNSLPIGCDPARGPVVTGGTQRTFQGLWCSDGTAISQIKFATKLKQRDPFRWLVVQKRSSTTILEPEIKSKPVKNTASMLSFDVGREEHIAVNPIVTLDTSATGGDTHCDFSINLGLDEDAPQIAIMDRSGNWSVWYIERERHGSTRTTRAVLKSKGTWDLPPSSGLMSKTGFPDERFRINWAAKSTKSDDWDHDSNPSDDLRLTSNALHATYLAGLDTTQSRFERIVISNSSHLQVLDATSDLSLSSSVIAVTSEAAERVPRPVKSTNPGGWDEARRSTFLRRKLLREGEKAFVVPDVVGEDQQLSVVRPRENVVNHDTLQLRYYLVRLVEEINRGFFGPVVSQSTESSTVDPFSAIQEVLKNREADDHASLKPLLSYSQSWQPLDIAETEPLWNAKLGQLQKSSSIRFVECGQYGPKLNAMETFEVFSVNWSARLPAESLKVMQWRYMQLALEKMATEVYLSQKGVCIVPPSAIDLALKAVPVEMNSRGTIKGEHEDMPLSQPRSDAALPTPSATPLSSRATSEALGDSQQSQQSQQSQDDEDPEEDPAITRLRMYLPSIKFTPPPRRGQSRVIALWPEQRGSDPAEYRYSPTGKPDAESEAAKRRRERDEDRRRRRAEKRAQIGIKMERSGESFSQPLMPSFIRSSPPPQIFANSQAPAQSFGSKKGKASTKVKVKPKIGFR
ncbi:hypothetical protein VMCG_05481 [Cytospora schulzeri]|uniref:Uncharacterized protein n=1 Tax=Cytospora schulzeri TaxID=448051 RepID=A0A423WJU3_9PEZI|nr:hypothetical protein VMCG_05481 [Valsa malicola]